jgi:LPS sulfotransferase NodH
MDSQTKTLPTGRVEDQPTRFIILSAARTGSTLLRHLLGSHPSVFAGGEVFNVDENTRRAMPWCAHDHERAAINSDANLLRLRDTAPEQFIEQLVSVTHDWGYPVVGFKWHYWLPDTGEPLARHLTADSGIRIIHLKRRNLLRQFLSYQRAASTNVWARVRGESAQPPPSLNLPPHKVLSHIAEIEAKSREYDECLRGHQILELFYEDLAKDPQAVGTRALEFLGVKSSQELKVLTEKTGVDPLRSAIDNYDELKAEFQLAFDRWSSFFEE